MDKVILLSPAYDL